MIVTGEYPPAIGGLGDYVWRLGDSLMSLGHTVTVLTTKSDAGGPFDPAFGPAAPAVRQIRTWGTSAAEVLAQTALTAAADVVHIQYQPAAYGLSGAINILPVLARQHGLRKPFVTTFHDLRIPYLFPKAGLLRTLAVHALIGLSRASIFTDPSDLARAHARRPSFWIPIASNISVVGARRSAQRARLKIREDETVVVHFGLLNQSKGTDTLLRAVRRLLDDGIRVRLLFVGDSEGSSDPTNRRTAEQIRSLAESLDVEQRIIRTGFLPPAQVSKALAAADVAALPYADGASLRRGSLLACLAHGIPVVTTRPRPARPVPQRSLVAPFDTPDRFAITEHIAALVPPRDDAALAAEISDLAANPRRRGRLAAAGRAFAAALSWENIARATASVYQQALEGRRETAT